MADQGQIRMRLNETLRKKGLETLETYWTLVKTIVPIAIAAAFLTQIGAIEWIAPYFAPIMNTVGLPPELGLAWLTGMIVGLWGAVPLIFTLVPSSELTVANVTVFSALILFTHGLPLEQKIIQSAGPKMIMTTVLRIVGGLFYAFVLNYFYEATGWLQTPVSPAWHPLNSTLVWSEFFLDLAQTMVWMFIILLALSLALEALRITGLLKLIMNALSPFLRIAGIKGDAVYLTAIGLLLGISYGAGLLIGEAKSGKIPPQQIFLSCVFMGFAHSLIEDTLLVMALGADIGGVLVGRVLFTFAATAAIALVLRGINDTTFFRFAFISQNRVRDGEAIISSLTSRDEFPPHSDVKKTVG
jgi:hypothetical protein